MGHEPQHVVPSWDLKTLWVNDDLGNTLTPIDPFTGKAGPPVAVHDPYNLYFTPDGTSAVVMASKDQELVFRDPHTMAVQKDPPGALPGREPRGLRARTAPTSSCPASSRASS